MKEIPDLYSCNNKKDQNFLGLVLKFLPWNFVFLKTYIEAVIGNSTQRDSIDLACGTYL